MSTASSSSSSSPLLVGCLANFVFLGPLLWIQELLQNVLTHFVTGDWGWYYPRSSHHWWSFFTMPSWGLVAVMWFALNHAVLVPNNIPMVQRYLIMATLGWIIEFLNGFVQEAAGSEGLQVWPGSPLKYVTYGCFLWWIQNAGTWFLLNHGLMVGGKAVSNLNDINQQHATKKVV